MTRPALPEGLDLPSGVASKTKTPSAGRCTLVGAGPGDPDLLTLKAVKAIASASVLLVDDLVNDAVLAYASLTRASCMSASGGAAAAPLRLSSTR